jgi:hypothetical protein
MGCLPLHGRVNCTRCFGDGARVEFDRTRRTSDDAKWRITANPLAWGNNEPEIVVLGFSKGPTQAGALATTPHDEIAYKGSRSAVGKILTHVEVMARPADGNLSRAVDRLIADPEGRFHFGSLVRCTVARFDDKEDELNRSRKSDKKKDPWKGSGGGMLDKFVATPFGKEVAENCSTSFLAALPDRTKLVIMFGLGTKMNYVREARKLISAARPGAWRTVNDVAYTDGRVMFVHVEHFASQGALIPNWLGEDKHDRAKLGVMAREAVRMALGG